MKSSAVHTQSFREILPFPTGAERFTANAKKMTLIASSCVALALAGILTRGSFSVSDHLSASTPIPNAPMALPLEPVRGESLASSRPDASAPMNQPVNQADSSELSFARDQLALYSHLRDTLQARMNQETSVTEQTRMRAVLADLGQNLEDGQIALNGFEDEQNPFTQESLKEQIFALQESGQTAVSAFIDADNFSAGDLPEEATQVFNVSRTGQ